MSQELYRMNSIAGRTRQEDEEEEQRSKNRPGI